MVVLLILGVYIFQNECWTVENYKKNSYILLSEICYLRICFMQAYQAHLRSTRVVFFTEIAHNFFA